MKNLITGFNHRDNAMDAFFGDTLSGLFRPLFYDEKFDSMKTDIKENEKDFELEIELPGYGKENVSIDYEDGYITVRADKTEKEEDKKTNYIRKERSISCQRSYFVGDIEESEIKAKFDNGILTVSVPKEERKKPQRKGILIE